MLNKRMPSAIGCSPDRWGHLALRHRSFVESLKNYCSNLTQAEGLVTGTAVKMFSIAGPVIVYGTLASAVYGAVLMLITGMP